MRENGNMDTYIHRNNSDKRASGFTDDEEAEEENMAILDKESNNIKAKNFYDNFKFNLNEIICIANISATAFGVGSFTFPFILYEIGVFTSLLIFIFLSASVYYTLDLLRRFIVDSKSFSYSSITQTTLGSFWLRIYEISSFLFFMSCIVNYLNIIVKLADGMMNFLDNTVLKIFYFLITYLIEVFLCLYTSHISKMFILSIISFITFIIILFTVIIKGIFYLFTDDDRFKNFRAFSFKESSSGWQNFLKLMAQIIEFFYGYFYHSTFPTLLSDLENLQNENTKRIHKCSFSIITIFYIFFSIFGLFCINDDNQGEKQLFINEIDLKDNTALNCIFKTIIILFFFSLIPVRYINIRDNYSSIIIQENLSLKIEIVITSVCLLINNIFVYLQDFEDLIFHIILIFGGAFGVFIGFILPVINYVAINQKAKIRAIIGYCIAGIFFLIGFFSIFYNFDKKQ